LLLSPLGRPQPVLHLPPIIQSKLGQKLQPKMRKWTLVQTLPNFAKNLKHDLEKIKKTSDTLTDIISVDRPHSVKITSSIEPKFASAIVVF
jgi:hypothetical protein